MELIVEYLLIFGILVSAGLLVISRQVLFSTLCLAANTTLLGFLFILKGMLFFGVAQIAVYAGGIIILLLLTIMVLGIKSTLSATIPQVVTGSLMFVVVFWSVFVSLPELELSPKNINLEEVGGSLSGEMFDHLLLIGVILVAIFSTHSLISSNHQKSIEP